MRIISRTKATGFMVTGLFAAFFAAAPAASAHTHIKRSEPAKGAVLQAAPDTWKIEFASKAEPKLSKFSLVSTSDKAFQETQLDATWNETTKQQVEVKLPKLAPGKYELQWSIFAADGHRQEGKIPFSVETK